MADDNPAREDEQLEEEEELDDSVRHAWINHESLSTHERNQPRRDIKQ